MVPLDTHEERIRAIQALPRCYELMLEGNPVYGGIIFTTIVGLGFWAATPWRWYD